MKRTPVLALLLLAASLHAPADVLVLNDGQIIQGEITEKGDAYEVRSSRGVLTIDKSEVRKRVKDVAAMKAEAESSCRIARLMHEEALKIKDDPKARNRKLATALEVFERAHAIYTGARSIFNGDEYADLDKAIVAVLQEMRICRDEMVSEASVSPPAPPPPPVARPATPPPPRPPAGGSDAGVAVLQPPPPPATGISFTSFDINAGAAGRTTPVGPDGFDIEGSGADIWDTRDGFRFACKQVSGDFDFQARVEAVDPTDLWAKGGVMVRQNTTPGSPHATMIATPDRKFAFQRRDAANGISFSVDGSGVSFPNGWVRLVRVGASIRAFTASDPAGEQWTPVGTVPLSFSDPVLVGLCVTSHKDGTVCRARFRDVRLRASAAGMPTGQMGPFVKTWMIIGPFDNSAGRGFDAVYPPEKEIDLTKPCPGMTGPVKWKKVVSPTENIDLLAQITPNLDVTAYAYAVVEAPRAMPVKLRTGSDDTLVVWLNGKKVFQSAVERALTPDQDTIPVDLEAGKNALLLKIGQGIRDWGFALRIEGEGAEDLKYPQPDESPAVARTVPPSASGAAGREPARPAAGATPVPASSEGRLLCGFDTEEDLRAWRRVAPYGAFTFNLTSDPKEVKEGAGAATVSFQRDPDYTTGALVLELGKIDPRRFRGISAWILVPRPSPGRLEFAFVRPNQGRLPWVDGPWGGSEMGNCLYVATTLNWSGWKELKMPAAAFQQRSGRGGGVKLTWADAGSLVIYDATRKGLEFTIDSLRIIEGPP